MQRTIDTTMIISVKSAVIVSLASFSDAFIAPSAFRNSVEGGSCCSLHLQEDNNQHPHIDVNRRQVLQHTFTVASSAMLFPRWALADAPTSAMVETSTATPKEDTKPETVVEKKEVLKAEGTEPSLFKPTPKYEKEIVTADASGASSSSTAVSSSSAPVKASAPAPVKEKELVVQIAPQPAPAPAVLAPSPETKPLSKESYALSIRKSTSALSTQLGHALLVVDGLNTQARRLSSSTYPDHGVAVLEGMNVQAKRLENDLTTASDLYKTIISEARKISVPEDGFEKTVAGVTRASSVLDGVLVQSKRLVTASSGKGGASTDEQITYMLSILDGLNTQAKRLNVKETFGLLDQLNSQAEKAT